MAQPQRHAMTFDAFLGWSQRQEIRHEFVDGETVAMAGASEAHSIIQVNLLTATASRLRGSRCRPFPSDMLVRTGNGRGRYPDMTIDCGPRRGANLVAPEPVVVFEVPSPDSQRQDRTIKLADYNATATIAHYVLVEQGEPLVHVYSRGPHGDFALRPQELRGTDAVLALPAVGISLPLREIYDGVDLAPAL